MDVLVDMVDPSHGNEVVFAVGSIALCQLDLVLAIEMIDIANLLSVRADHVHTFLDLRCRGHESFLPCDLLRNAPSGERFIKSSCGLGPAPAPCLFESVNGDLALDVSAATPRRERQPRSSCCRSSADDDAFGRGAHRANESAQIEAGLILLKE
jgi:hypothetical protein